METGKKMTSKKTKSNILSIITDIKSLHQVSAPVLRAETFNIVEQLYPQMVDTLISTGGVGLAAPQIGINKRFFVIKYRDKPATIFINPTIVYHMPFYKNTGPEGCLSIPSQTFLLERARIIRVKYFNEKFEEVEADLIDTMARIYQHELDHLNGILISDIGTPVIEN